MDYHIEQYVKDINEVNAQIDNLNKELITVEVDALTKLLKELDKVIYIVSDRIPTIWLKGSESSYSDETYGEYLDCNGVILFDNYTSKHQDEYDSVLEGDRLVYCTDSKLYLLTRNGSKTTDPYPISRYDCKVEEVQPIDVANSYQVADILNNVRDLLSDELAQLKVEVSRLTRTLELLKSFTA